jgi:exodeoxyribonuclease VII large subunit
MAVYSVSQVTTYIKEQFERDALLQDIWVEGEIANLARPGSGHSYFTLRDAYEVRGDLQLIVDIVQPEGAGELQLKLEQLKLKLENAGLFAQSRKRPLPVYPERIGVVTSPTGAVWQDIQTVVARRYPLVELALAPTPVQGENAAPGIVEAFAALNELPGVDAIILARGGGSLEDLWPFNEEVVAHAVYSSRAPVITGVGHETDVTVADLVADVRAPTPSAAAELAVPDQAELATRVIIDSQSLDAGIWGHLGVKSDGLERLEDRLERSAPDLDARRLHIDDLLSKARTLLTHGLEVSSQKSEGLRLRLESLSPLDTLRRGYAIVQSKQDGSVVSDAEQVDVGDPLNITVGRGALEATVDVIRQGNGSIANPTNPTSDKLNKHEERHEP